MAAPNNLSIHSPFSSSTQQQSLRTPDANSLFSSSSSLPTPHDISIPNDVPSVNSLEDLLSFSGITNGPTPSKRHIDEIEVSNSKRVKLESQPQDHIPSILSHTTTSNLVPSILSSTKSQSLPVNSSQLSVNLSQLNSSHLNSSQLSVNSSQLPVNSSQLPLNPALNGGVILPLLKPPLNLPSLSSSVTSSLPNVPLSVPLSDITSQTGSTIGQPNGGSVALLVQLYKHFQSTGDSASMTKIHQQLLALHSQLATKAGAYLSSLTTPVSASNNLLLTSTNQTNNSVSIDTSTNSALSNQATTTTTTSSSSFQLPSTLLRSNSNIEKPLSALTSCGSNVSKNQLQSNNISSVTTLPPPYTSSSPILTNPLQFLTGNLSNLVNTTTTNKGSNNTILQTKQQHTINTTSINTTPKLSLSSTTTTHATSPSIVTHASPLPSTLPTTIPLTVPPTLPTTIPLTVPPTIPTTIPLTVPPTIPITLPLTVPPTIPPASLSLSSTSSTSLSPLPGLQVTAQTQANVLRAVYSYRIQRIQEFLASLPADQRPTTTQELRDLLNKNNILTKAFPPDIITSIQQQLPLTLTQSSMPTSTTSITRDVSIPSMTSALSSSSTNSNSTISNSSISSSSITSTVIPSIANSFLTTNSGISLNTTGTTTTTASSNLATNNSSTVNQSTSTSTSNSSSNSSTSTTTGGPLPGVTLETLRTLCRLPEADLIRIPMPSMLLTVVQYMRANKWNGSGTDLPLLIQQAQDALAKGKLTTATPQPPTTGIKSPSQTQLKQPIQQPKLSNPSPLSQYMASVGVKLPTSTSVKSNPKPISQQNTTNQNKTVLEQSEKDRIAALQKVLQSSEEARIAFRFQAHLDKLHQQISTHEIQRPFLTWQDLILRLLPYHIFREPELPPGAMEKADAVYEGIAGVLLSRSQGLMNQYQKMLLREEHRHNEEECTSLVLERLWLEGERERKEQEEKQKREAEQIAAELSAVGSSGGGGGSTSFLDSTDPFLLNSDSYDDYSFLDQFWGDDILTTDGLDNNNFDLGIT